MAYKLLCSLCKNSAENFGILSKCGLFELLQNIPRNKRRKFRYRSFYDIDSKRSKTGYAGIRNPCCICYMNAMNQ